MNILQFQVDRTFSREYGSEKGYALFLDLTADKVSGTPAIQAFTLGTKIRSVITEK